VNFPAVDFRIPYGIGDFTGFDSFCFLCHIREVFFRRTFRDKIHKSRNSLRNRLGRHDEDLTALRQHLGLVRGKDDILVVRKDEDIFRMDFFDGFKNIFRARVHGLSAFNQAVDSEIAVDFRDSLSDGHGNESVLLRFGSARDFFRLIIHLAADLFFFRFVKKILRMFLAQVIYFDFRQRAVKKSLLNHETRVIGMDMDFDGSLRGQYDNAVADGSQIILEFFFFCFREASVRRNEHFRAVAVADFSFILRCFFFYGLFFFRFVEIQVDFFAVESIDSPVHDHHEALSAGIDNTRLLEDGKHFRGACQRIVAGSNNRIEHELQIVGFLGAFRSLVRHAFRNGQDRAFLRLHDRFVGIIHTIA